MCRALCLGLLGPSLLLPKAALRSLSSTLFHSTYGEPEAQHTWGCAQVEGANITQKPASALPRGPEGRREGRWGRRPPETNARVWLARGAWSVPWHGATWAAAKGDTPPTCCRFHMLTSTCPLCSWPEAQCSGTGRGCPAAGTAVSDPHMGPTPPLPHVPQPLSPDSGLMVPVPSRCPPDAPLHRAPQLSAHVRNCPQPHPGTNRQEPAAATRQASAWACPATEGPSSLSPLLQYMPGPGVKPPLCTPEAISSSPGINVPPGPQGQQNPRQLPVGQAGAQGQLRGRRAWVGSGPLRPLPSPGAWPRSAAPQGQRPALRPQPDHREQWLHARVLSRALR